MRSRSPLSEKFLLLINGTMVLIYATAGIFFLFGGGGFFPEKTGRILGIVLLLYAAYRAFSVYKKYNENTDENQP
jgi:hypothetical protein